MIRRLAQAVLVAVALMTGAPPAEAQKTFSDETLAGETARLEAQFKEAAARLGPARPAPQARSEAESTLAAGNPRGALVHATAAIAAEPKDWRNWISYSRAAMQIDGRNWDERQTLQERMATAAYAAYLSAPSKPDEAAALAVLAETFVKRSAWRRSLNAYRASLQLNENAEVRRAYEALRGTHGFRITNFNVESDSASPRACFQFSEPLATGKVDFAPFVAVSGAANPAISAEGAQLCVGGLSHGQRYAFVIRQGLPSEVVRDAAEVRRLRSLCARPFRRGALHGTHLRPAPDRPGGHPGRLRQHVQGRRGDLPDRRPQPRAHGPFGRFPVAAQRLFRAPDREREGRQDLVGEPRHRLGSQPGRGHRLPGPRRGRNAAAGRLCDDGARPERRRAGGRRGLRDTGDAMVHRLRSRPHRPQGRRRRPCPRAVARQRGTGPQRRSSARRPQQRDPRDEDDGRFGPCGLRSRPCPRRRRSCAGPRRRDGGHGLRFSRSRTLCLRPDRPRREGPSRRRRRRRLRVHRARRLPDRRDRVRDGAPARREGSGHRGRASDPGGAPPRRRRIPPRHGGRPGSRWTRAAGPDPARRHAWNLAHRRLYGSEGHRRRRSELPRRGLRPRAPGGEARTAEHIPDAGPARGDRFLGTLPLRCPGSRPRGVRRGRGRRIRGPRHQGPRRLRGGPRRRAGRGFHSRDRGESRDRCAGARHAAGADPGGGRAAAYGGAHHAAGCRVGRPGGRAQRDAADPAERPRDRRAQEFRRRARRGLDRHVRRGARLTGWPAAIAAQHRLEPREGRTALSVVQCGRTLGL